MQSLLRQFKIRSGEVVNHILVGQSVECCIATKICQVMDLGYNANSNLLMFFD